jgi:hypothetical protein
MAAIAYWRHPSQTRKVKSLFSLNGGGNARVLFPGGFKIKGSSLCVLAKSPALLTNSTATGGVVLR